MPSTAAARLAAAMPDAENFRPLPDAPEYFLSNLPTESTSIQILQPPEATEFNIARAILAECVDAQQHDVRVKLFQPAPHNSQSAQRA